MMLRLLGFALFLMMTNPVFSQMPPVENGVSKPLAEWRARHYSNVRYKLNLTLEQGAPLMKGEIEVRVTLDEEATKNPLVLDWRTTQFANDKDKPFANVVAVNDRTGAQASSLANVAESGVAKLNFQQPEGQRSLSRAALMESGTLALQSLENEHLLIPNGLLKKGENTIKIQFASPIKTSGSAITRYIDKEDGAEYIYSLLVPSDASTAFPVFDQPDLKARFQLTLQTAGRKTESWKVVSNAEPETVGSSTWGVIYKFKETKPISTYVFAFAAGDFVKVSEPSAVADGSDIYVRKSQAEKFKPHAAEVFRLKRECVTYLEGYFDYKFPFPKYDLVLIPEFPFGGMEHAGATFLRESSVIFPSEPTKNDYISRATLIFHETAHQWFGDLVTMKWFDDLWLKEGFATFMGFKALEKIMPEHNAWKAFYERNKQAAYQTDSTKGTTPIYQEIPNLSAAKSAYGAIVYSKAPSFLRQAEFYLGEKEFQTAVRSFLKKHEFANATWQDLVTEFEIAKQEDLKDWGKSWVTQKGMPILRANSKIDGCVETTSLTQSSALNDTSFWKMRVNSMIIFGGRIAKRNFRKEILLDKNTQIVDSQNICNALEMPLALLPNYQDYGYGIFLLDKKSQNYILANVQNEKDDFLRAMMYGSLWDSVREAELNPKDYVELVIKNVANEKDETIVSAMLGRANTALNYYIKSEEGFAGADGFTPSSQNSNVSTVKLQPPRANASLFGKSILKQSAYLLG